jgi:1,4-dihydroxy-2-naphthoate octaprenyltransferase
LTYTLGASIPAYLGRSFQPVVYALGLAGVLLAELSMALLAEVFRPHNEPLLENETPQQKEALRTNALYLSIAALSSSAFFVYLLYIDQALVASSIIFIVTSFVLVISYSIPPIRLVNRGFGELTLAAHIAYVVPSIGFLLQAQDNHRLLAVIIIPLTALALAYFIVVNFTSYLIDQKYERGTLLRRLTWERAVPLHHGLIVFAYVVFAVAPLFGFSILGTAFLTLPFALLQIILVRNLSLGAKPNWVLLTSTALAVFGLTTYFITLTFWLR